MKNKVRKHGCRFDPDEIMLMVLIFVLLGFGILALTEIGSLVWDAITNIRVTDPAQEETAEGETLSAEAPAEGIGRAPAVTRYLGAPEAAEIGTAFQFDTYTEGEGPAPAWYRPDEPMSAEWEESYGQVTETNEEAVSGDFGVFCGEAEQVRKDAGCPDWNLCSTLYGAHGLTAEPWELDLMARIVSREVCGCSRTCWEAVADSILRRVESGYWGSTIYSVLSAVEENGAWAYDTWPYIWDGEIELYDEIRAVCEDRFYNGAQWDATHFRTEYYHPWAISLYEIDGVYFSQSPYLIGGGGNG